jgi:hypothetical protein
MPSAQVVGLALGATGAPLESAEVIFMRCDGPFGTVVLAAADGTFASPKLTPGNYQVEIRHPAVASYFSAPLALARDEVRDLGELRLGSGGALEVTLVASEPDLAQNAWVFFAREDDDAPANIERQGDRLVAKRLAAGRYRLSIGGARAAATSVTVDVEDGGRRAIDVKLVPAPAVVVRVTEAARTRQRSLMLTVTASSGSVRFRGPIWRDPSGEFALELALEPGEYQASAADADGRRNEVRFRVREDSSEPLAVELALR